ncbi:type II toxin-antitoxin system VapB family antitoxin [Hydrogenovibrio marinus]|uniref:Antitoxin n=1 Tax=Hydrogenovibrio marinus TaxID=28885 RepID=A0A067A1N0_HYDMR|nr:type II toxin-antitoxin system VapB family antitoxin [Hydrogenovibrio marinus]KDN96526.1 antitoxin [Hydrogenovibrio marinus]BBN60270.1 antitoxin [Hydrogenovibrio marinus]
MINATVFENNKTQAVRLPVAVRFPDSVKKVVVRVVGKERIISPLKNTWDSFFLNPETSVSDDFLNERAEQTEALRESFDD